jgi:hypothetical protein
MAQQHLNDTDINAVFEQVRGEAVPQRVRANMFGKSRRPRGFNDNTVQLPGRNRLRHVLPC